MPHQLIVKLTGTDYKALITVDNVSQNETIVKLIVPATKHKLEYRCTHAGNTMSCLHHLMDGARDIQCTLVCNKHAWHEDIEYYALTSKKSRMDFYQDVFEYV